MIALALALALALFQRHSTRRPETVKGETPGTRRCLRPGDSSGPSLPRSVYPETVSGAGYSLEILWAGFF